MLKISCLVAFLLGAQNAEAQQLFLSSQYHQNMLTINPAYSGYSDMTNIVASHRSMLTGLAGSPQTSYVSVDGQGADGKMGLAFVGFHDQTDILSMTSGMVNYVYKAKLGTNSKLNFGLGVGVQNFSIGLDKAVVVNPNDPILYGSLRQNRTAFNSEFGLLYQVKGLEVGVAIPQLFNNNPTFMQNDGDLLNYNSVRHFRGSLKYNFENEDQTIKFYPLFVLRTVKGAPTQWDLSGVLDVKKAGWIGVTYHNTYSVSISAGVRYQGFSLGYAHGISVGDVSNYSRRSSELIMTYQLGDKWKKQQELNKKLEKELKKLEEKTDDIEDVNTEQDESIEGLIKERQDLQNKQKELEKKVEEAEKKAAARPTGIQYQEGQQPTAESVRNTYRTAKASDFVDENGRVPKPGFYVVIGAFGVEENAKNWKRQSLEKGNSNTAILYNSTLQVREVFLYYSPERDPAMVERMKRSGEYPTVWVQKLE